MIGTMLRRYARDLFSPRARFGPAETAPLLDPRTGKPAAIPRGVTLREILASQFAAVGIKDRHLDYFASQWRAGRWGRTLHQDFWGPQAAQLSPAYGPYASVIPANAVAMPDFNAFASELKNVNEVLRWGLYDRVTYPVLGAQTVTFFQQSLNQGYQITNMLQPGALPGNQSQLVMGIRIGLEPSTADVAAGTAFAMWYPVAIGRNWVELTISTKNYVRESPIAKLAPGYGLIGSPGLTFTGGAGVMPAFPQVGNPQASAIWNLNIPLGILPTRTFNVTLNWIPTVSLGSGATEGHIVVELDGLMLRAAQ